MADPPVVPQVSPPLSRVDLLVGALLVLAAAGLADRSRMVDPDLFMNLFSARDIFTAGGLPGVDTHSFARDALPWTDYEWLARIIQLSVYEARGGPGLVLLRASQPRPQRIGGRLNGSAADVSLAEPADRRYPHLLRPRAARIVRKPPAVARPREVKCADHAIPFPFSRVRMGPPGPEGRVPVQYLPCSRTNSTA